MVEKVIKKEGKFGVVDTRTSIGDVKHTSGEALKEAPREEICRRNMGGGRDTRKELTEEK